MTRSMIEIEMLRVESVFESDHSLFWPYLKHFTWPWEALPQIGSAIREIGAGLSVEEYNKRDNDVWIHKSAVVAPTAFIGKNVIIGANTEIRHCAFIRENALVGKDCVVGNSTELKNAVLFDQVQVPHFNYIGDSILGYKSHLGAGAVTSNVKSDKTPVSICVSDDKIETGLKKFGAILGDNVEVGCNTVLNPGSVVGAGAIVYPLSFVRGFVPPNSIYKKQGEVVEKDYRA